MYSLNLTTAKKSISLLLCLALFACSATEQVSHNQLSDNGYVSTYIGTNFSYRQFPSINSESIKKPLNSDHQLMMSLLNRPITADQVMMLAFAQERANDTNNFANYVNNAVMIKGDKTSDNSSGRTEYVYAQLISQDINAVSITGL